MKILKFFLICILAHIQMASAQHSNDPQTNNEWSFDEQDAVPDNIPPPEGIADANRPVVGVKKVLVAVVNWEGENTLDKSLIERHTLSTDPDSLRSYILAASKGKLTLDGSVIAFTSGPRPELCKSGSPMPLSLATQEGAKAAAAQGLDPANFDFLINIISCGGYGSAYVPGRIIGVYGPTKSPHVYKHEFGHNLGYQHGKTYVRCQKSGDTVTAPAGCTTVQYGDTGDTLSGGGTLYPAFNRWYSGWLDPSQAKTINVSGLYHLGVLGGSETQLYLIERPGSPSGALNYMSLEYRQPTIFDNFPPTDNRVTGIWVRFSTKASSNSNIINTQLDSTPETSSGADPTLQPGRTLIDDEAGIKVKVCTTNHTGATFAVAVRGETLPSCTPTTDPASTALPF
ncbi:hypothetical protein [Collimonas humicola]|uniref:hypothetical protein n=1 Tax=Collimonas humicola TaxID=2825886 RepID=UPI001B8C1C01|nr:hypothetical protein [Collimonas humicola]